MNVEERGRLSLFRRYWRSLRRLLAMPRRLGEVEAQLALLQERQALLQEQQALLQKRLALLQERLALLQKRLALLQERLALLQKRQALLQERQALLQKRLALLQKRLALLQERLALLENHYGKARSEVDWLLKGVVEHNDRLDNLDQLLPLKTLVIEDPLPFAWRAPEPGWLEAAERRIGRTVSELELGAKSRAFYAYFSEIGGDHRPILHQQYQAYLPVLRQAVSRGGRILDVGCGAGELLQYLQARGIPATGIDMDAAEVDRAQSQGLDVSQASVDTYLEMTEERFAAITLLQVIEHIPRDQVAATLQACVEHLLPGGVLLVETVNLRHPLSLNGFYTDPTHKTPLADTYLAFLFQWLGLQEVGLLYTFPEPVGGIAAHDRARFYHNYTLWGKTREDAA